MPKKIPVELRRGLWEIALDQDQSDLVLVQLRVSALTANFHVDSPHLPLGPAAGMAVGS